ncbi:MAG: antitoxin VapB family protein [Halobacteriales archaeon]|nr:antitoxin VapB family protein [Halobacteriales archaeon]
MTSTTIRLDESVYERLKAAKRPDETFSEAVDRLLSGRSLLDLVGLWSEVEVETVRAKLDEVDADAVADVGDLVDRTESG